MARSNFACSPDSGRLSPSCSLSSRFDHKRDFILQKPLVDIYAHIWHIHPEKRSTAMLKTGALDQLQQIHELNRAFLGCSNRGSASAARASACRRPPRPPWRRPAAGARGRRGVPARAVSRAARAARLARVRRRRRPTSTRPSTTCVSRSCSPRGIRAATARYQARLLFGLDPSDVERLRALAARGHAAARLRARRRSRARSRERQWFWQQLFTVTRPELRRQLTLMALQPCLALGWPQRRPPQPSA